MDFLERQTSSGHSLRTELSKPIGPNLSPDECKWALHSHWGWARLTGEGQNEQPETRARGMCPEGQGPGCVGAREAPEAPGGEERGHFTNQQLPFKTGV